MHAQCHPISHLTALATHASSRALLCVARSQRPAALALALLVATAGLRRDVRPKQRLSDAPRCLSNPRLAAIVPRLLAALTVAALHLFDKEVEVLEPLAAPGEQRAKLTYLLPEVAGDNVEVRRLPRRFGNAGFRERERVGARSGVDSVGARVALRLRAKVIDPFLRRRRDLGEQVREGGDGSVSPLALAVRS